MGSDALSDRLAQYRPGARVTLLVARHGALYHIPVTLGAEPLDRWTLAVRPDATVEQRAHVEAWFGK